MYIKNYMWISF